MENEAVGRTPLMVPIAVTIVLVSALNIALALGARHIREQDYRPFAEVVAQCKSKGYVQNGTTRVLCDLEPPMVRAADIHTEPVRAKKK